MQNITIKIWEVCRETSHTKCLGGLMTTVAAITVITAGVTAFGMAVTVVVALYIGVERQFHLILSPFFFVFLLS